MATTIGSLDLNAFDSLYSDSNQYFWFESNSSATYGAGVHITLSPDTSFIANPTGQNILINTDGISIRNGLLPMMTLDNDSLDFNMIDTTSGTYANANVASFGLQTRIGRNETGYSRILIDPSSDNVDLINAFEILTPDGFDAFVQRVDTKRTISAGVNKGYLGDVYSLGSQGNITTTSNAVTKSFTINDVATIPNNQNFTITFTSYIRFSGHDVVSTHPIIVSESLNVNFTKGTSQTISVSGIQCAGQYTGSGGSAGINHIIQVVYNGVNNFTVTSTAQKVMADQDGYNLYNTFVSLISYEGSNLLMPILSQRGDAIFCGEGVGRMMIDFNVDENASATTDATSGDDMILFNTIKALGWYDDVTLELDV